MRAISFMKTAVLAFAMTALGGIQTVFADDTEYTATFTLSNTNGTVTAECSGPDGITANCVNFGWNNYAYVSGQTTGTITVNNFKYAVKNVKWIRWKGEVGEFPGGYTYINFNGGSSDKESIDEPITILAQLSKQKRQFVSDKFSGCDGIYSFVIENNGKNGIEKNFWGRDEYVNEEIFVNNIYVTYYEPELVASNSVVMSKGECSKPDITINHAGAFSTDDIVYTSSNKSVISVVDGKLEAEAEGSATITATLKNNGVDVTSTTFDITVVDAEYGWTQGELYSDYKLSGRYSYNNADQAWYTGETNNCLRTGLENDDNGYHWGNLTSNDNEMSTSIYTNSSQKYWRVGVGLLNYFQYLHPYTSVSISYDFYITGKRSTNCTQGHGVDFIDMNSSMWNRSTSDKFRTGGTTSGDITSLVYKTGYESTESEINNSVTGKKIEFSNTSTTENLGSKSFSHQFALDSYTRNSGNSVTQTGSITANNRQVTTTYYAYLNFDANGGTYNGTIGDQTQTISKPSAVNSTGTTEGTAIEFDYSNLSKEGCTFVGWNTKADGTGEIYTKGQTVCPYDSEKDCGKGPITLYAVWAGNTSTITFDAGNGYIKSGVSTNNNSSTSGNPSTWTINVKYGQSDGSKTWGSFAQPYVICDGFFFDGWYTKPDLSTDENSIENGEQVYDKEFQAVEGNFWKKNNNNLVWKYGSITLYAHYTKKWTYSDGVITFIDRCKKEYSSDDEKAQSIGAAINECYTNYNAIIYDIMAENLEYIAPSKIGNVLKTAMENGEASKNVLVYCNDQVYSTEYNIIKNGTCPNLVVTDKEPMKIAKEFKATNSSYTRSSTAKWGTLFLPFPISINSDPIEYYELSSVGEDCMKFNLYKGSIIPANTPIVYCRTSTDAATVTMKNTNNTVTVPVSDMETTGTQTFGEWNLIGTRKTRVFYGPDYDDSKLPEGATKQSATDIYCISNNKFYCLKNTGKATIDAFRAYFQYTNASSAKQTTFRIIVNEFDGATDVTDILNGNESQGDGKIYDLNGRRIQTPLKGHLYIINGKKVLF